MNGLDLLGCDELGMTVEEHAMNQAIDTGMPSDSFTAAEGRKQWVPPKKEASLSAPSTDAAITQASTTTSTFDMVTPLIVIAGIVVVVGLMVKR